MLQVFDVDSKGIVRSSSKTIWLAAALAPVPNILSAFKSLLSEVIFNSLSE